MTKPESASYQKHREAWRRAVRWEKGFTWRDKAILMTLDDYRIQATGRARVSDERLGEDVGAHRNKANIATNKAVELGYLKECGEPQWVGKKRLPCIYEFLIPDTVPGWVLDAKTERPGESTKTVHTPEVSTKTVHTKAEVSTKTGAVVSTKTGAATPKAPLKDITPAPTLTDDQKRVLGIH